MNEIERPEQNSGVNFSANNKKRKKIIIAAVAAVLVVAIVVVLVVVLTQGGISKSAVSGVNIGDSKAQVTEKLGEPAAGGDGDTWEFYDSEDAAKGGNYNYASVTFENDKAVRVVFNTAGKNTEGKTLQSISMVTEEDAETVEFYVSDDADNVNAYDVAYLAEYDDGSFSKDLVARGVHSASAGTVELEWTDAFGNKCNAGIRFTYPYTVQYVMNGGINSDGNISGYSAEWMQKHGEFTLLNPEINAHEFTNISLNADGTINCTVIEKQFDGWYSDAEFTTRVTSLNADSGDITLYAKWGGEIGRTEYKNETFVRGADKVLFGSYPQTIKDDGVTVSGAANENGYFTGSDGALYAAVRATPHGKYKFSNGASVREGETYYFKVEPLEWRIIESADGNVTLLCEDIIYGMNFDKDSALWDESEIRQWLNNGFYNSAFSASQANLIVETALDNGLGSVPVTTGGANSFTCADTTDKVWLLSYEEVQNTSFGFVGELAQGDKVAQGRDSARSKKVTDYAAACGALMVVGNSDYAGNGSWWLRSAYYGSTDTSLKIMDVRSDGYVGVYDESTLTGGGIVPAITVSLS